MARVERSTLGQQPARGDPLPVDAVRQILDVTLRLTRPFNLVSLLAEVAAVARQLLDAERASVFLYEAGSDELVMTVVEDIEPIRVPAGHGLVGHCARTRQIVNVPDCYADPRFNDSTDRLSGYRTRCMLSLPLIGYDDTLVGVLQLLNKRAGVFDEQDERVAELLGTHCAAALQRARDTEALLEAEHLHEEIRVAREIQMSGLPAAMPPLEGYDGAGLFRPTDQTGGDLYDFVPVGEHGMFLLLGDATGHGIGPALSATQVRAMVRVALRLGADLDAIHTQVNNQLLHDLPDDRFVTAFLGLLDARTHEVRFHAAGQAPLLHLHAATGEVTWHGATTIPLGALELADPDVSHTIHMAPGDVLGLISDGIYEYHDMAGQMFGESRVAQLISEQQHLPMRAVADGLLAAAQEFGGGARQQDDITIVMLRRLPDGAA
jgi:phosphoserine phosphatase RsbU/P